MDLCRLRPRLVRAVTAGVVTCSWLAGGCAEPGFVPSPLPTLVRRAPQSTEAVAPRRLLFFPGERMVWDVRARGISVGRAKLSVGAGHEGALTVSSVFRTHEYLGAASPVDAQLTTRIDLNRLSPMDSDESFDGRGRSVAVRTVFRGDGYVTKERMGREPERLAEHAMPGTGTLHNLHTVLGTVRGGLAPGIDSGRMVALIGGRLNRIDIVRGGRETLDGREEATRVDCRILPVQRNGEPTPGESPTRVTLWMSEDATRMPVRIDVKGHEGRVSASLIRDGDSR